MHFLKGLTDRELWCDAIRGCSATRSLYAAFVAIEEAYKSRMFIKKIKYEEVRTREALFYKDVVKRNVSTSQLESILVTYQSGNGVSDQNIPDKFLLSCPESSQKPSRPAIESKSVSWSVDPPEVRRIILRSGSSYEAVSAGSVVIGHGPAADQGVGQLSRGGSVSFGWEYLCGLTLSLYTLDCSSRVLAYIRSTNRPGQSILPR